jgi:hypothetical protein
MTGSTFSVTVLSAEYRIFWLSGWSGVFLHVMQPVSIKAKITNTIFIYTQEQPLLLSVPFVLIITMFV